MKKLNEKLKGRKFSKVIDIATRNGAFIKKITEGLSEYDEIVGIDISDKLFEKGIAEFRENDKVRFEVMDAYNIDYPDGYFDLVCISNSLHHMEDMPALLKEVKRIKNKDGIIIISEMPSDGQSGASLTHALIHELDCMIDTYSDIYHHKTYSREEIIKFVLDSNLKIVDEFNDVEYNLTRNKSIEARVDKAFVKIEKFKNTDKYEEFHNCALEIKENFDKHGANAAVQYIIFAK